MSSPPQHSWLALPTAFPDTVFEAVKNRIAAKMRSPSPELDHLGGGHNGVRFRLRACADYSDDFIECVQRAGDAPPIEDRYRQERQLFGFFVSGIAALDSFNFFIHFAAAHVRPAGFPTQKPGHIKAITRKSTASAFGKEFPHEVITTALTNLVSDSKLQILEDHRNILAHRSAPGRVIHASFGTSTPDPPAEWRIDPTGKLKIDADLTPPRLKWLVSTLADLVMAADQFTQKHF